MPERVTRLNPIAHADADRRSGEVRHIVEHRAVATLFQAIVEPRQHRVFGYEALSRGPSNSRLHAPANLFTAARREGLRLELELLCVELAAIRFVAAGFGARLFVNISPDCIYEEPCFDQRFLAALARGGLSPQRCVIELTEDGLLDDYSLLRLPLQRLRTAGVEVAIDDLGAGSSGLRVWLEVRPDYVKIDRYFVSGIDTDRSKIEFVRSIVDLGHSNRCKIIAEGVESDGECRQLARLRVDGLQGYHFGRPAERPHVGVDHVQSLEPDCIPLHAGDARQLVITAPAVGPDATIGEVARLFRETSNNVLAIVREGRPIGVVRRDSLFGLLSKPFHLEVYSRKAVADIAESDAIVIDARARLDVVSRLITADSMRQMAEEFVITDGGQYLGIGQTLDVLRLITEQQVAAARHSNPLTLLPGNGPIRDSMERLIASRQAFTACQIDLDHFKPYNDIYGFAQGDRLLLHLADQLRDIIDPGSDFLGHIGGDDFVLITRRDDWADCVRSLFVEFASSAPDFYSADHASGGAFESFDRSGLLRAFPLVSISVAALDSRTDGCVGADSMSLMLAELKKLAKRRTGSSIVARGPEGIVDLTDASVSPVGA